MKEIHPLLVKYKVNTVFAGHWHEYKLCKEQDGVRYIITGGGGAEIDDMPYKGGFYHHLLVTVADDKVQVSVIKTETGTAHPQDIVTEEKVQKANDFLADISFKPVLLLQEEPFLKTLKVTPKNTFDKMITINLSLQPKEGSGWACRETQKQVILESGKNIELSFEVSFDGKNLFPVPETQMECFMDGERILKQVRPLPLTLERALHVKKTGDKINIDGKLDEESWKKAEVSGKWINTEGTDWANTSTDWSACYDNDSLYLAFNCRENEMEELKQSAEQRDWQELTDDCVILYMTFTAGSKPLFFCFGVNTSGTKMDYNVIGGMVDFNWNPDWDVQVLKGERGYIVEIAIPFKILLDKSSPSAGAEWYVNAFRMSTPGKSELSGWCIPVEGIRNPAGFKKMIFE